MRKNRVLIADDEKTIRETLAKVLDETGFSVTVAANGLQAAEHLAQTQFDVALLDIRMPGMDGLQVLQKARQVSPSTSIIIITAFGTVDSAVNAIKMGASDYVTKPFVFEDIIIKINRLLDLQRLTEENRFLQTELREHNKFDGVFGTSRELQETLVTVEKLAQTRTTALITGESGTGKEVIARAIHYGGVTRNGRFVAINCAALPENLVESELFGHKAGAFSGATSTKLGLFEIAEAGTVFLDEIGATPPSIQAKLLRAIEEKQITPIGGTEPVRVDVRVLCATNTDLRREVEDGRFREDLYYRLSVVEILLPPLRRHRDDIPLLVEHFVKKLSGELNKGCKGVTDAAMRAMMTYSWPGNIRELRNVIERAMIFADDRMIDAGDLSFMVGRAPDPATGRSDLKSAMRAYERQHILGALTANNYDKVATARDLNVGLSSLYRKMEELGIGKKNEESAESVA